MFYLDTSVLVPLFVPEPESESVELWFKGHLSEGMTISDWSLVEFASAMSIKVRNKVLRKGQAANARQKLGDIASECFTFVSPSRAAYAHAAELCTHHSSGLRAGDALHLAVAMDTGATSFITLDRRIVSAVRSLNLDIKVMRPA